MLGSTRSAPRPPDTPATGPDLTQRPMGGGSEAQPRRARHRPSRQPPRSMRGRCLLVFLGLVMANGASRGRSHQPMVARDVSGGTADDRMQPFALAGSVAITMASASAVRPRIAFMKKLRSMPFQSMCRALSSEKRLARVLLLMANFGKERKPEPVIAKISQETLAEMIGTTRSRVSTFMNKFRELGLNQLQRRPGSPQFIAECDPARHAPD